MNVSMKELLEAGVHFGHQMRRWNPKMAKYIFAERNGIYIVDLQKTLRLLGVAYEFVRQTVQNGGKPPKKTPRNAQSLVVSNIISFLMLAPQRYVCSVSFGT